MLPFPIIVLSLVFLLTAFRQVIFRKLRIWQIMAMGAATVLLTGQISFPEAVKAVNMDVMLFLFGMFLIGSALEESGYLSFVSYMLFRKAGSADALLLSVLFGAGIASAFLLNDTLAIIGTPVVLLLAKKHGMKAKPLILALCFSVTIGSVMSPIGNPQNLLIAVNGNIEKPFTAFFSLLLIPTIINLLLAYCVIKLFYPQEFGKRKLSHSEEKISDIALASLSKMSLVVVMSMVLLKMLLGFLIPSLEFKLTYIALVAMIPVLLSPRRTEMIRKSDWRTLVFFASMFVLMESVWNTGFFQSILASLSVDITSVPIILAVGVLLSQLISNVPLAALYLPIMLHAGAGTKELVSLAAASTIGGNLFILGAASNVIIIQNAERKSETITFFEFARVGIPLTAINIFVYWIFLAVL